MIVKILGAGCSKCSTLEQKVRSLNTLHALGLQIEKVSDLREIMQYGILSTPGLVIDGVVKSSGSVPKDSQLLAWLKGDAQ